MTDARLSSPGPGRSDRRDRAQWILDRYSRLGDKRVGGPGDKAVGTWISDELAELGYRVTVESFKATWSGLGEAFLAWPGGVASVISHPGSPAGRVVGPMSRRLAEVTDSGTAGAIAVLDLPYARWSSARDGRIREGVRFAIDRGAKAVVLVTHGPSGLAVPLNTGASGEDFPVPVAILSPRDAMAIPGCDTAEATLQVERQDKPCDVFNVVGQIDRGAGRTLVVSTPRSGWSICSGERGSGLASWLLLVEDAARSFPDVDIVALCTTAHERGYAGMGEHLSREPTPVDRTALWVHIGANAATRDWREVTGGLTPLPSADPQRFLAVSPALLSAARASFAGAPGLEVPHDVNDGAGGELGDIARAGYPAVAGVFGAHRFHHTAADDQSCVSADLSVDLADRMQQLIQSALRSAY